MLDCRCWLADTEGQPYTSIYELIKRNVNLLISKARSNCLKIIMLSRVTNGVEISSAANMVSFLRPALQSISSCILNSVVSVCVQTGFAEAALLTIGRVLWRKKYLTKSWILYLWLKIVGRCFQIETNCLEMGSWTVRDSLETWREPVIWKRQTGLASNYIYWREDVYALFWNLVHWRWFVRH